MANNTCGNEKVVDFSTLSHEAKELVQASVKARENSYSPFSHFAVGAALRCDDGSVVTGCNVENSSIGLSICAERTAIVKAVSEGYKSFGSIAVSASLPNDMFTPPCGACRQFISEFSIEKDIHIYLTRPEMKKVFVTSIRQILPLDFHLPQ